MVNRHIPSRFDRHSENAVLCTPYSHGVRRREYLVPRQYVVWLWSGGVYMAQVSAHICFLHTTVQYST